MSERDLTDLFVAYGRELEVFLVRQLHCPHTAADLVQQVFLRLAQQPAGAGDSNMRAYLYRVARNLAIDHFRREERRHTVLVPAEQLAGIADDGPAAEQAAEARQRLALLCRAIAELPPRTQAVFTLNRIEGLSYAQVAHRLAISESSVQKHLARALHHAMQRLKDL